MLFIFLLPSIFAQNEFYHISTRDFYPMDEARKILNNAWKIDSLAQLDWSFTKNFRFIDCDLKTYGREEFLNKYIRYSSNFPVIKDASYQYIIAESTEYPSPVKPDEEYSILFDVELKNGRRIGFKARFIGYVDHYYYLEEAIVYNCFPEKPVLERFINYKQIFKAQKFIDEVWKQANSGPYSRELTYFQKEGFVFVGCPRRYTCALACSTCDSQKFINFYIKYRKRPEVKDVVMVKNDQKWQFEVESGYHRMHLQMEDIEHKLVLTKGRELDCLDF